MTAVTQPRYQFQSHPFHMVEFSPWPLLTANAVLSMMIGGVLYMHGIAHGMTFLVLGTLATTFAFVLWFRDMTTEGTFLGDHTLIVQKGLTMGVSLFIVTEIFFFLSIFWAYFHSSLAPTVELGSTLWSNNFEGILGLTAVLGTQVSGTPGLLEDDVELPYGSVKELMKAATDSKSDSLFTMAKRYAASGDAPTADMINLVQGRQGSNSVTEQQVALFKYAFEHSTHSVPVPLGHEGWAIIRSMSPIHDKTPGCYIVTHTESGAQGVGSSMHLAKRLRSHLSDGYTGARISQHLTEHGRENHSVQVVRLPLDMPQTQSAVLAFEQYLFLLLNPSINLLFIAGSSSLSDELTLKLRQEQGTPVYLYYKGTLVAQTVTVQEASDLMSITRSNVRTALAKDDCLVDFKVTTEPILGANVNIMDVTELKALLNTYREVKLIHLYIGGVYIDSYEGIKGIKGLAVATGFTLSQVHHALSRSNGHYHNSSDIMFSRTLNKDAPTRVMTKADILEYCAKARTLVASRNMVYLYCKGELVNKFTTLTQAYDACPKLPISFKGVYASISRHGKYVAGDYTISSKPL